ncbi:hypothetical protein JCM19294_2875 [Nonlabens tegetincola]|uniref:Uncharacterized protein n=1 Tax=Nonlabens tegetincola TaxID=323273 RepID=A0A090Q2Y4_9FLAO|nr:hypothetical protein JCM19294_2875 [Nonlabens tegetincola]
MTATVVDMSYFCALTNSKYASDFSYCDQFFDEFIYSHRFT